MRSDRRRSAGARTKSTSIFKFFIDRNMIIMFNNAPGWKCNGHLGRATFTRTTR
jgi:hypothetical protein